MLQSLSTVSLINKDYTHWYVIATCNKDLLYSLKIIMYTNVRVSCTICISVLFNHTIKSTYVLTLTCLQENFVFSSAYILYLPASLHILTLVHQLRLNLICFHIFWVIIDGMELLIYIKGLRFIKFAFKLRSGYKLQWCGTFMC